VRLFENPRVFSVIQREFKGLRLAGRSPFFLGLGE